MRDMNAIVHCKRVCYTAFAVIMESCTKRPGGGIVLLAQHGRVSRLVRFLHESY
jgi:hypothetical protein